jgi:DNA repair protein SbcD/Mre11
MKILHFADIHIGMENYAKLDPKTGLSTRLLDFFETFDFIVETALEKEVDAVVFAGDAYKTRDPNPTQQRGFGERIRRLAKKVPVILVVGNHDTPNAEGRANTLDIYSALEIDNVWVSRSPEYLKIKTKSGDLQIITLPWLHKNDYKTIGEKLHLLYEKIEKNLSSPAVFLSHAEIVGAQYGSEKGMAIANDVTIPLSLIQDRRLSYVALGHIHKHQVLSKPSDKPLIVYAGSPHRIDFGEEKEEKGICLVDIDSSGKASFEFIKTPCRSFLTITINLKDSDQTPTKTILDEIGKYELSEKVVRIIINIPSGCDGEIEVDKIKKSLSKANFIAGISRNIERKERPRFEGTEEVERLTPIDALRIYFETKKYTPEKKKRLEEFASSLLER